MNLDTLQYQIDSISLSLRRSYMTKAQIIDLLDARYADVSQIRSDIQWLREQYNLITEENAKLLTTAEYDELMAIRSELVFKLDLHQTLVNNIITKQDNLNATLTKFEEQFNSKIEHIDDRLTTLENQFAELKNQLSSMQARLISGGL